MSQHDMPRVRVLTTGGTIASRPVADDLVASDGPEDLLAVIDVPGVDLEVKEVLRVGSYRLDDDSLRQIAGTAVAAAEECDGVVVTHGTDTMEETAFLTDLVHGGASPIVFTGAQRHAGEDDRDGPRNLTDAVRVAADPRLRDVGATICMDRNVWPARFVTKGHTLALDAFTAPDRGPVATCHGREVRLAGLPARPARFSPSLLDQPLPRVDIVAAYAGVDGALVRAAVDAGARGVVIAAFGAGNVTPPMAEEIRAAVEQGVAVVVTSRTGSGPVVARYGGPGGGSDLARAGAIFGGALRPAHARLVLALALTSDDSMTSVADAMVRHG